jgi:deferrochelatase/peroxidase EfeB
MTTDTTSAELADMQGLLRSGFRTLPHASYDLYHLGDAPAGRRFLGRLSPLVTSAAERAVPVATQVAVSAAGLRALGLPDTVIEQFSLEFQEGMGAPARSRFLGDEPQTWAWGAPAGPSIDVLVATYADTTEALADTVETILGWALEAGATPVRRLGTQLTDDEAFGFRDGVSDPYVAELASSRQKKDPPSARPVPLGEFVLGYPNAYGLLTQRPVLPTGSDPTGHLPVLGTGQDAGNPGGGADLGRNGSYLVLRSLQQDTAGFADYVDRQAAAAGVDSHLLAAKMVGRWRSGAPLVLAPEGDDPGLGTANEFGYHHDDERGQRCPIGSHIRRANPRDSLDPDPGSAKSLEITDRHRLLRRGRRFAAGNDTDGLHFLALNGNLGRQFEFVQHTWLDNPKFGRLHDDVDPIVSPRTGHSVFTVPDEPVRRRFAGLPQFVTTLGGAYLFLPGLRALRYLSEEP